MDLISEKTMKAIDTEYKGQLFRSRLEAKYAVYFDELNVKWDYEPEGFESEGVRYLPDFYFPEYDVWAEIKPTNHANKDMVKWKMLSKEKVLIVFEGNPHAGVCKVYGFIDPEMDIIPFACKLKESYGMMWHATGNEDFSDLEPFKSAIKKANYKRF